MVCRVDPKRDLTILERTPIDYLDFAAPESGLGSKLGIDAAGLNDSVARMNAYARTGTDADFARMGQGRIGTLRIAVNWFAVDPGPAPAVVVTGSEVSVTFADGSRCRIAVPPTSQDVPAVEW